MTVDRTTATAHKLSRYDGACANVHGHNIDWEIEIVVSMEDTGNDNMPLDFKQVSEIIDQVDHELLLSREDEMLELDPAWGGAPSDENLPVRYVSEVYGPVWVFDGDPTCELLADWMRSEIGELDSVVESWVTAYETEKYGMKTV